MDITTVHLVRHGEVYNPDAVLYGRRPGYHLSELGHKMASELGQAFAEHDVLRDMASPLERAIETATPTAQVFGLEVAARSAAH